MAELPVLGGPQRSLLIDGANPYHFRSIQCFGADELGTRSGPGHVTIFSPRCGPRELLGMVALPILITLPQLCKFYYDDLVISEAGKITLILTSDHGRWDHLEDFMVTPYGVHGLAWIVCSPSTDQKSHPRFNSSKKATFRTLSPSKSQRYPRGPERRPCRVIQYLNLSPPFW
jgi:hypothetical protein